MSLHLIKKIKIRTSLHTTELMLLKMTSNNKLLSLACSVFTFCAFPSRIHEYLSIALLTYYTLHTAFSTHWQTALCTSIKSSLSASSLINMHLSPLSLVYSMWCGIWASMTLRDVLKPLKISLLNVSAASIALCSVESALEVCSVGKRFEQNLILTRINGKVEVSNRIYPRLFLPYRSIQL